MQLFASSQLESEEFGDMEELANHMGLFLQKTNIIRDYLEDINEEPAPRCGSQLYTCCRPKPGAQLNDVSFTTLIRPLLINWRVPYIPELSRKFSCEQC